jgi:hypothetical protein
VSEATCEEPVVGGAESGLPETPPARAVVGVPAYTG